MAENEAAMCAGEQQHLQGLKAAWFSNSSTVPSVMLALLKGFALKNGNLVLPGEAVEWNSPKAASRTPGLCSCTGAVFVL